MPKALHPNISLLERLDIRNLDTCKNIIADNFIWHYFNPKLPELEGDYRGIEELKIFFAKLAEISNGSFQVNVIDGRAVGDELVVIQTCNRIKSEASEGDAIDTDVVVVWRVVNGKIAEGWDIPSVYNIHTIQNG